MRVTGKLLALGLGLLVAALALSALALMVTGRELLTHVHMVSGLLTEPTVVAVYRMLPPPQGSTVYENINVSISNRGSRDVQVTYISSGPRQRNVTISVPAGETITVTGAGYFDTIIIGAGGPYDLNITVTASLVRRDLLPLSLAGFASFVAGTVLTTMAVVLRLSGVEEIAGRRGRG